MTRLRTFTPRYLEYRRMRLESILSRSLSKANTARQNKNLASACYYLIQAQKAAPEANIPFSRSDKIEWGKFFIKHKAEFLSDIILEKKGTLENLELYSDEKSVMHLKSLLHVIAQSDFLQELNLLGELSLEDTMLLTQAAMRSATLKKLIIGVDFTPAEFNLVFEWVSHNRTLEVLDLAGAPLDQSNMKKIAALLKINTTLKELNLNTCNLKDTDVITLTSGLKQNHSLTTLRLHRNQIQDEGIVALANAAVTHPNLTHFNVSYNCFSNEGQQALIGLKKSKPGLTIKNDQHSVTQQNQQKI